MISFLKNNDQKGVLNMVQLTRQVVQLDASLIPKSVNPAVSLRLVIVGEAASKTVDKSTLINALERHQNGDWGELHRYDRTVNEMALEGRTRIFSTYRTKDDRIFWIISELSEEFTLVVLPIEY